MTLTRKSALPFVLLALCGWGCSNKPNDAPQPASSGEEEQVRKAFTALQEAIKAKDADKMWALLDDDSQADAGRAADAVREAYGKAGPADKAEMEKNLGLTGADLAALKGQGFLKTKRFLGKYDEIPESKVTKVSAQGDKAGVDYTEPDGDNERLGLVRQKGQWKFVVPMPKAN